MSGKSGDLPPHVLHVLPGGHAARLVDTFGNRLRHTLVTRSGALPDGMRQTAYVKSASTFPPLGGMPLPGRMQKLARAMTPFDLVVTYGYDALDAAMAHTLFKDAMNLPALVHHEAEPDTKPGFKRTWYRRIALGKAAGLVVPSERLEETALVDWQQPMGRVKRIVPGVDTKLFAKQPKKDGFRIIKRDGELWVGAWPRAGGEGLDRLIDAFSKLSQTWQLIVLGEDIRSPALDAVCERLKIEDRVFFPGTPRDPAKVMGLFDVFVQPAHETGFPLHIAQAMAAGVPIIAPGSGEAGAVIASQNAEWLVEGRSNETMPAYLRALAQDRPLRRALGEANRAHAVKSLDTDRVMETYRRLYASAMKREF